MESFSMISGFVGTDYTAIFVVAIVFGFVAFTVLVGAVTSVLKERGPKGSAQLSNEEAREIQELYRGFEELSKRVESLETILLEGARKG